MIRARFVGGTSVGPAVSETVPAWLLPAVADGVPELVPPEKPVGSVQVCQVPESMGSTTKNTAAPSRARTMIPAMIMVVCDIGFFGPVSFGTSFAFSGFGGSLTGAGAVRFSSAFTGVAGGTGFSSGTGTAFSFGFYRFFHLHRRFSGRFGLNNRGCFRSRSGEQPVR